MPRLLDSMPFPADPTEVAVRGERVRIRANQIIIWVSLSRPRLMEQAASAIPFPAILDTGYTHSFAIHERHLTEWAGIHPEVFVIRAAVRERGQRIPLRAANLWAHANQKGSREQLAARPPHLLETGVGIAVYPGGDFPRLPIVGLRVIAENNLILRVSGHTREATLHTRGRRWPFGWGRS